MKRRFTDAPDAFGVVAEINVTSLVDVAFTLLIIFMITAPILQGGIEIDVPEAVSGPLSSSESLVVSIDAEGQIFLDDVPVTFDEFANTIELAIGGFDSPEVFLKADTGITLGTATRVMSLIQDSGGAVSIITEPPRAR